MYSHFTHWVSETVQYTEGPATYLFQMTTAVIANTTAPKIPKMTPATN